METHSSIPAWRIPWTEEPGRLQSKGLERVEGTWYSCMQMLSKGYSFSSSLPTSYLTLLLEKNHYSHVFHPW